MFLTPPFWLLVQHRKWCLMIRRWYQLYWFKQLTTSTFRLKLEKCFKKSPPVFFFLAANCLWRLFSLVKGYCSRWQLFNAEMREINSKHVKDKIKFLYVNCFWLTNYKLHCSFLSIVNSVLWMQLRSWNRGCSWHVTRAIVQTVRASIVAVVLAATPLYFAIGLTSFCPFSLLKSLPERKHRK